MMEEYLKIKAVLCIAFMDYLEKNRPENKMCLSNGECADIDDAFLKQDWAKLMRYAKKYLPLESN